MKKIIIQVKGGLGNQLFSYAMGYSLATKNQAELILDASIYQTTYKLRSFKLPFLRIKYRDHLINYSFGKSKIAIKLYRIYHSYLLNNRFKATSVVEDDPFELKTVPIGNDDENLYLIGYWQNFRYFNEYRSDLIKQFQPSRMTNLAQRFRNEIIKEKGIAVHIRRGDYVTFKNGSCLSKNYYINAIEKLRTDHPGRKIYFFSDDVNYVYQNFSDIDNSTIIPESLSDIESLFVMSFATDFVLSNSTFSWWAAYLGEREQSHIIAPVVSIWKENFYLDTWEKISAELDMETI